VKSTFYYKENMPVGKIRRFARVFSLFTNHFHDNQWALLKTLNVFKYKEEAISLRTVYKVVPFLGRGDYEVIHCHFGPNGQRAIFLKELGIFTGKIITVFHGYDMSQYIQKHGGDVYKHLFDKGDLFLPISDRWKKELISMGCPEDKIRVHHMGIDPQRYDSIQNKIRCSDKIRILSIGRFVEKKGIRYGIEAVGRIIEKHPEIEYRIIGDGELRNEVELIINQTNLREKVKLLGWKSQEEILTFIKDSDIFLAPSVTSEDFDQEGIPVVLMEAMAMCLPVLSTYHSAIPELVSDGVSGLLVPERDVDSLANSLAYLIDHPQIWAEMGLSGRQIVEERFNINKLNDNLVELYDRLVN